MAGKARLLACGAVALLVAVGCGGAASTSSTSTANEKPMTLRFGYSNTSDSAIGKGIQLLAEGASKKSGGKLTIKTYPANQLGTLPVMFKGLQDGTLDMEATGPDFTSGLCPGWVIASLPYVFDNFTQAFHVMDGSIGKKIDSDCTAKVSVRTFAWTVYGTKEIFTSGVPINSMADMKKLKVRVPESPVSIATYKAWGATPTVVAFSELYTALQNHTVNSFDNPIWVDLDSKFNEVTDSVVITDHLVLPFQWLISDKVWTGLPQWAKDVMTQTLNDILPKARQMGIDADAQGLKQLQAAGQHVYHPDKKELKTALQPIVTDQVQKAGLDPGLLPKIYATK